MVERADIFSRRLKFLKETKKYWDNGRWMSYTDEIWIDSKLAFRRFWKNDDVIDIHINANSGNRPIMLYVG